ncbi:hypothetical protein FHS86_001941 [Roseimarinus sediminis]
MVGTVFADELMMGETVSSTLTIRTKNETA